MKKSEKYIVLILLSVLCGCEDIFEKDIEDRQMEMVFPVNRDTIHSNHVDFRWKELEGAGHYRLQVEEPGTGTVLFDTVSSGTNIRLPFTTGSYSWQIRGENFAYVTAFTDKTDFSVILSDDLTRQAVFLRSPSDGYYTNRNTVILTWDEVAAAGSYTLQIDKTISGSTITVFREENLAITNYTVETSVMDEDGIYSWKIKAVNEKSETPFVSRKIFLDTREPEKPVLVSPNNNGDESEEVAFSWKLQEDIGEVKSPVHSILEIASDDEFRVIVARISSEEEKREYTFNSPGEYYWRVQAKDKAGNTSVYSETRKLTVK